MRARWSTAAWAVAPATLSWLLMIRPTDWHAHQATLAGVLIVSALARLGRGVVAGACVPLMLWPIEWEHGELVFMHQYLGRATVDVPIGAPPWLVVAGASAVSIGVFLTCLRVRPWPVRLIERIDLSWRTVVESLIAGAWAAFGVQAVLWALGNALTAFSA
jgi:hypothetical protein